MDETFNLGSYFRPITANSSQAQKQVINGLIWTYAFNHHEAIRCFKQAVALDPDCALAHWGLADAQGPYINKQWSYYNPAELRETVASCYKHSRKALQLRDGATPVEQALIEALTQRYQAATADLAMLTVWERDYADQMRRVYQQFPADQDVIALSAESLMMLTPWDLWDTHNRCPQPNSATPEMMRMLEHGMALSEQANEPLHPGVAHMYIHTVEMAPNPEIGLKAADGLCDLVPDAGHLLHMPGHIYMLCGDYRSALNISYKSVAADQKYIDHVGLFTEYTAATCHDYHLMMSTAMFLGQYAPAKQAADAIDELLTDEVLCSAEGQYARTLEGYHSMQRHVDVRFGRWQALAEAPLTLDSDLHPVSTAMHHYGRAIALAALGDSAESTQKQFYAAYNRISPEHYFFNNLSHDILNVAAAMMEGEVAYHAGHYEEAFDHLRLAVTRNDALNYTEPWAWMHPPRHALGALLLAQNHVDEALQVYYADLGYDQTLPRCTQHPDNVWALHGLAECLRKLGHSAELTLIEPRLQIALARADQTINSSCCCRV